MSDDVVRKIPSPARAASHILKCQREAFHSDRWLCWNEYQHWSLTEVQARLRVETESCRKRKRFSKNRENVGHDNPQSIFCQRR
ncbi:hypothetical protein L798_04128 [Zootermopsis nevadensis]|uniref:Uncharacterized protein n=1 Tax=Zootermopsis nevadensis TaxID=136037 RepID=A0A067RMW5_ZOONE|nr:hypothetical protein L798_04128 [Zootermopsis nevadensis]